MLLKFKPTLFILVFLSTTIGASTTEVFRYSDKKGRTVFTDRPLSGTQYQLIWRATLARLDAQFERPPHLPINTEEESKVTDNKIVNGKVKSVKSKGTRNYRRKSEFTSMIQRIARSAGVNENLVHAVVQAESGYNPKARSHAGAIGLMQLMPATAKRYGVTNIWDPEQNVTGGSQYLKDLLELFDNNLQLAVAAYNAGEGAVLKYGKRIPPYRETREYVRRVIKNFKSLQG